MQASRSGPMDLSRAWAGAQEHNVAMKQPNPLQFNPVHASSGWSAEFGNSSQVHTPALTSQPQVQSFHQQSYMSPSLYGGMNQGFMQPMNFNAAPQVMQVADKGKGKAREIDFEAAFAELDEALGPSPQEMARIEEWDDVADLNEVMSRASVIDLTDSREEHAPSNFKE